VILPTALFKANQAQVDPGLLASLHHLYLMGWVLTAAAFIKRRSQSGSGLRVFAVTLGFFFAVTYALIAYGTYTGHVFDVQFALDSLTDVPTTVRYVLGPTALVGLPAFALLWFGFTWLIHRIGVTQTWKLKTPPGVVLLIFSLGLVLIRPGFSSYVGQSLASTVAAYRYPDLHPFAESVTLQADKESNENIFFLQLESVNAVAGLGHAAIDGKAYKGDFLPRLGEVAKQGVFFPFAWGNTIQTARATETILCGMTNNTGAPLTFQPKSIKTPCLSELLGSKGFTSLFFSGSRDQDFHNREDFLREKGFAEVLGPEIMPGVEQVSWGYDECEFFQNVFGYLERQRPNPNRLFIQVAVYRNHYGFGHGNLDSDRPFAKAQNFIENYLNSLVHQDRCVDVFWKRFERYAGDHSHLFVFGDHSWPVGINGGNTFNEAGSHVENFSVPVVYVPPRSRQAEFATGSRSDVRVGQSDLVPTALEVLGLGTSRSSFAPILRGEPAPRYEECHILVQPYSDPSIVVVRRSNKYTYHLLSGELTTSAIAEPLEEGVATVVEENLKYSDFKAKYGCERYRDGV
jgi:hypothetical protein